MIRRNLFLAAGIFTAVVSQAQVADTDNGGYYRNPMDIPTLLSANFAEMRANHFHAGIDIKTQGVEGKKVFAAADGYVSRAGISPGGYGKALYIDHPNGTTTVYAHLQRFTDEIEKYIDDWRYANKKHSGDVYFKPSQFPVRRGDLIGLSGNTGMSGGPHLHYEIRESASQEPTNIVARGYLTVKDNIPPRIVRLYCVGTSATTNGVIVCTKPRLIEVKEISAGIYTVSGEVEIPHSCFFLLETTDRKNDVSNTFGVYSIRQTVDGDTTFELALDRFVFGQTRYKHAVSYFPLQRNSANEVFRLMKMPGNRLSSIYGTVRNSGIVNSRLGQRREIRIDVTDDSGNTSTVSFTAKAPSESATPPADVRDTQKPIAYYNKPFSHSQDGAQVTIPTGALYESMFYTQTVYGDNAPVCKNLSASRKLYAPVYGIGSYDTPLHKAMTISIDADAPEDVRSKLCMAYVNEKGKISSAGGKWADGKVTADVRNMGRYTVVADTVPPRVKPSFASGANLSGNKQLSFAITDDFAGICDFEGTIDGKWILFDWNIPQARIVHNFDNTRFDYSGRTHDIRLIVTDGSGNETVWEGTFVR